MSKNPKKSNYTGIIALVLFAVVLFASVPFVGDWILETFIYAEAEPTTPSVPENSVPGTSLPSAPTDPSTPSTPTQPSVPDTTAPVISGVRDQEIYVGDSFSYRSGVTVTDDLDPNPKLSIDNSQAKLNQAGVYTICYTATDASGNSASVTMKLTVKEKPENFVEPSVIYAKADAILAQFIREDMTDREKVEAVYVWTRRSVHLTYGSAPKGFDHENADWLQTAWQLLNKDVTKGDCFYFFAVQKLLLQRLGIPTIDCEKIYDGKSHHYWLLVSIDGGKSYYHFDNVWSKSLCLVTDAQLDAFSAAIDSHPFNRNPNLYPATPAEPLPAGELPWTDPAILAAKP